MRGYLERCLTSASRPEAEIYLEQTPQEDVVVVLDEWKRPLEILERHPLAGLRGADRFLRVQLATDPSEAHHRALTRGNACRFDPFAVINEQGEFQGITRMDRLMHGILKARHTAKE